MKNLDFTFAEIDILIKNNWLDKKYAYKFNVSCADKGGDMYRTNRLTKKENGEWEMFLIYPINVDCDDGSYDSVVEDRYYKTLEDVIKFKPYKTNRR